MKKEIGSLGDKLVLMLLFITFLVLKLCGVINWAWIWIFAPIWIPTALAIGVIAIVYVVIFIQYLAEKRRIKKLSKKYRANNGR